MGGCGRRFAMLICKRARIPLTQRAGTLTEEQCTQIQSILEHPSDHGFPTWMLNRRRDIKEGKNLQLASTALDSYIREDVETMKQEARRKKEEGRSMMDGGRKKKEEGRRKKEEGRRKK